MARRPASPKSRKDRTYPSAKLARAPQEPAPDRVLRVWRRVLERRLRARLRGHVALEIHDNTHTMITFRRARGTWHLRLHHMFLGAQDEVLDALAEFVRGSSSGSSALLDRFIAANRALIRKIPVKEALRRLHPEPVGRCHDLKEIYDALNRRYFGRGVEATITFGPAPRTRRPRKSIKMGSYSADARIIRIHPALDHERVPRYFVEWIVFHEMLHHLHRARRQGGRRCVHTPEFLRAERRFHDIRRAQKWEDENLD